MQATMNGHTNDAIGLDHLLSNSNTAATTKSKSKGKNKPKTQKEPKPVTMQSPTAIVRQPLAPRQRIALCVGAVASFVLLLSVWHCTEAIRSLTGSPIVLSLLLAVGIDLGMVVCEVSAVASKGKAREWAERYVLVSVALSSVLNSVASGSHAEKLAILAYTVGALVPMLVFGLAKVATHLWTETEAE